MLNEVEVTPAPPQQRTPAAAPVRQSFPPEQQSAVFSSPFTNLIRARLPKLHLSRVHLIYAGTAAVLFCACIAFFLMWRHVRSIEPPTRTITGPPAPAATAAAHTPSPAPAKAPVTSAAAPVVAAPADKSKPQEAVSEPVDFRLKRSKSFEKIGPIRLRLLRTNPKRNLCDLYLAAGGPSFQRTVHLNKPLQIDLSDGSGSAELLVTAIKADQVSGSVQQK